MMELITESRIAEDRMSSKPSQPVAPAEEAAPAIDARAVAIDTLQTLGEFTRILADRCRYAGELFRNPSADAHAEMVQLADGLGTFHESLTTARAVLEIPMEGELIALEADFKSILEDLAVFHEQEKYDYVSELLFDHLAANLDRWGDHGLGALIARIAKV